MNNVIIFEDENNAEPSISGRANEEENILGDTFIAKLLAGEIVLDLQTIPGEDENTSSENDSMPSSGYVTEEENVAGETSIESDIAQDFKTISIIGNKLAAFTSTPKKSGASATAGGFIHEDNTSYQSRMTASGTPILYKRGLVSRNLKIFSRS